MTALASALNSLFRWPLFQMKSFSPNEKSPYTHPSVLAYTVGGSATSPRLRSHRPGIEDALT